MLARLADQPTERLTVADILAVLRDRAFALLVVILGLPNCLPMPPPIPLVCGLLLALVAAQIVAGRPTPWLPRALLHRSIRREDVERAVNRALPVLRRAVRDLPAFPMARLRGLDVESRHAQVDAAVTPAAHDGAKRERIDSAPTPWEWIAGGVLAAALALLTLTLALRRRRHGAVART